MQEGPSWNCIYYLCTKSQKHNTVEWQCTKSLRSLYFKYTNSADPIKVRTHDMDA